MVYTNAIAYISIDPSAYLYFRGLFQGIGDFDPGIGISNLTANEKDIFILKLDSLGNFIWVKNIGALNERCYGRKIL
jgi:hypothetical protein